ncbi:hypothetical protein EOL06_20405 [Escherichia coli]|nr:hypothetical protein EOL06_20405 [Escherichia coli]
MKKRHLLSLLALGISTACYGETYPAPIGPSQSDFGGVGLLQTPTARMAREGELSISTVITQLQCNSSRGWKQRCATPTCAPGSTAASKRSLAIKRIKIKPSISNCVCGKRVTGCRKWRLVRGISAVRGCLMRNILLPAKPGDRSISRSAWAGDIWAPAVM